MNTFLTPPSDSAAGLPLAHDGPQRTASAEAPLRADPVADTPRVDRGPFGLAEAVLRSPAAVLAQIREGRGALTGLALVVLATMVVTGVVMASFSGGAQFAVVPVKLALGAFACALVCLPSLHVFSCLSGARQRVHETWGALLMGVALTGVLLVGFAPVLWVFAQATRSVAFMGALHLVFFLLSATLGLALTARTLTAMNGAPVRAVGVWGVMFVCVLMQMATTLRPLVGPYDGLAVHGRAFFVAHWVGCLAR